MRGPQRIHNPVTAVFTVGNKRSDTSIPSCPQVRFSLEMIFIKIGESR